MKTTYILLAVGVAIVVLLWFVLFIGTDTQQPITKIEPNQDNSTFLVGTIPLSNVNGRIDHFSVDVKGGRLFVTIVGNDSVEVVDLNSNKAVQSIKGLRAPHGPLYIPEMKKLLVTNGRDGTVDIYDGETLKLVKSIAVSKDADNIRYDPNTKIAYLGHGSGSLGIIDVERGELVGDIPLAGHPEELELEKSGPRIFVNVPADGSVTVIDREKRSVIAKWSVKLATRIYPIALDETNHRLFVGTRDPDKLVVFDTASGNVVADVDISKDPDDIWYDANTRLLRVSCGEGFLNVIKQEDPDHYRMVAKIPSGIGGRTSIFVPEYGRIYVGVPSTDDKSAEIQVFGVR